jgi:hypothetical protein
MPQFEATSSCSALTNKELTRSSEFPIAGRLNRVVAGYKDKNSLAVGVGGGIQEQAWLGCQILPQVSLKIATKKIRTTPSQQGLIMCLWNQRHPFRTFLSCHEFTYDRFDSSKHCSNNSHILGLQHLMNIAWKC